MYVYVPDKVATNPPILTLIHSCDSNASVVLGQAPGLKSAADQYGFIIVLPQSNPSSLRCWTTDSTQVWTRNSGGDSNAIKQMVVYALSTYKANADRVYAAGCSSGAMMTELLLGLYPDIFKAGSSFAGMPAGCHGPNDNSSSATGYNGTCAGGPVNYTPQQWGGLITAMYPGYTGHRPRLQLFHGSADPTINYVNMAESCEQYENLLSLSTTPTKTVTGLTLGQHQGTEQQWNNSCGYLVLDAFDSINGDHGPSDDLFDPTYVVPFLGLNNTGAVDPEIAQCGDGSGSADGGTGTGGSGAGGSTSTGAGGKGGAVGTSGGSASGGSLGGGGNAAGGSSGKGGGQASGGSQGSGGITSTQGTGGAVTGGASASGSSSGSGGSSSAGSGSNTGAGGNPPVTPASTSSGSSCAIGSSAHARPWVGLAILGLALLGLARRRRVD
jgi:poly(hydroxyalkanoate) depolymerase family esterase